MYFIKRSFKYLKKKKGKTFLLGIIFLVISNFVLAGLLVQNASEKTQENTRIQIGADVIYTMNLQKLLEDAQKGAIEGSIFQGIRKQMISGLVISDVYTDHGAPTYSNFLKVIDSEYVQSYDISVSVTADSNDGLTEYSIDSSTTNNNTNNQGSGQNVTLSAFTLNYHIKSEPMDFVEDLSELTSGRYATDEEIAQGAKVMLIEENVSELNDLDVGDIVSFSPSIDEYQDAKIEYEIIGTYSSSQEIDERILQIGGNSLLPQNKLYVPFTTIDDIGIALEDMDHLVLSSNIIRLYDPLDVDVFLLESAEKVDFGYGMLDANNALYENLVGPIESLGNASSLIVIIIVIAGALIIGLITALTVNERKEEIGILLAIGEQKYKIVSQFVLEVLVIAVIAFSLSIFTGAYIGQAISDRVLESDLLVQEQQVGFINPGSAGGGTGGGAVLRQIVGRIQQQNRNIDIEKETSIDISLTTAVLIQLYGTGLLLAIFSTMIPSLYVMRFNPKQILTNKTT